MHLAILAGGTQVQSVSSSTYVKFLNITVVAYLSTQGEEAGSIGTDFGSSEMKFLNPLTLISDEHVTSPCNIHTLFSPLETKILKVIR